jgi:Ca2+-binding RTX toxin-like protein
MESQAHGAEQLAVWELDGTRVLDTQLLQAAVGTEWHIAGFADVNGDGKSDVIMESQAHGTEQLAVWELDGTRILDTQLLQATLGAEWHVLKLADVNGDGKPDVLFESQAHGVEQLAVWELNGSQVIGQTIYGTSLADTWHPVVVSDFNGDHKADVFWRNDDGPTQVWQLDGLTLAGTSFVHGVGADDGNNIITGGNGSDTLIAGGGTNTITGGPDGDHFVFHNGNGLGTITDFTPTGAGADIIELYNYGVNSFVQLQDKMTQVGTDVHIDLNATSSIVLQNVSLTSLTSGDFIFG